ncbi:MAG: hypothetical protein FJ121_04490 [Deltaproteobacteria bacterium]|nr:hypothetical protein [Deltaproteobacteria bacterium]
MSAISKDSKFIKSTTLIIISLLSLIGCINSDRGKLAEDAILSMKKLEAKCNIGINYNDYTKDLGETAYSVRLFVDSKSADKFPNTKTHLVKAFEHYKFAKDVWEFTVINFRRQPPGFIGMGGPHEETMRSHILKTYPDAPNALSSPPPCYQKDSLLPYIWNQASVEIKKASDSLEKENKSWFSKLWG